ncbi:diguanylate cyclase [Shewanella halifaxensis HAW-EB4]|uniref:diguanylate cyclase n=1 Tax=Shewanella halifaxensis (strain HAW-EB4) TaxID=458817 RepID=B0TRT3_SHEHH|nr:diguanylate cyclase [Shewanella halifaxensis]ABZ77845.1 diguanylate cyclase [Shewanella halifaxensis HAW-EB4]
MDRFSFLGNPQDEGLFDIYSRQRVLTFILLVTLMTFLPLSIKNFVIGETLLGFCLLAFELSLVIEVFGILRLNRNILGYRPPLFLLAISMVLSIHVFGTLATYWVFPVVTSIVLLVPKKMAMLANGGIILTSAVAALPHQEPTVTLRFILALLFCVSIAHYVIETVRKLQANLSYLSTRDSLTGALNRHQLDVSLITASEKAKMEQATCIAAIDIDYFKDVNDVHGHDVGDQVIKTVVKLINCHCRKADLLFRLGGDEFLLLFDNTKAESALKIMRTIGQEVAKGIVETCPEVDSVTLSTGIAESIVGEELELWVKRADLALYEAKHAGRNQVKVNDANHFYSEKVVDLKTSCH